MSTITGDSLLQQLNWRYATKAFDPTKQIPSGEWAALEQALVLSASSFGLQPWKFIVVTNPELKAKLRAASWNQSQVEQCSHLVVFVAKQDMTVADIDRYLDRIAEVRGVSLESLAGYRGFMVGNLVEGPRHAEIADWAARQTYIAMGNLLTSAALLGLDTCPMEGIDPRQYDAILGLDATPFRTVVACPVGYRAEGDKYATLAKVRFPVEELVELR